ncbi:hydrogenase maturation nickel metallochaperone HypA [Niveibacterium sp. SC-1]|uniref:hydrogenase maturation nickel metallochaperone HypA/HybF n=1 Tax=Niveibacterium sp. SC-1 TaxID=3135646 RepID=UPI00311DE312
MHELALAEEVALIVDAHSESLVRVTSITLAIGELAGVEVEALLFALESTLLGGKAAQAEILVETVPGRARCGKCGTEQALHTRFDSCEACGAFGLRILQGDAMQVRAISGDTAPALH